MRLWSLHPKYLDARVTRGQLEYEWIHRMKKLAARDPRWRRRWTQVDLPQPHPLFRVRSGGVAAWERAR